MRGKRQSKNEDTIVRKKPKCARRLLSDAPLNEVEQFTHTEAIEGNDIIFFHSVLLSIKILLTFFLDNEEISDSNGEASDDSSD